MKISDFDYNLPEENIAVYPPKIRGDSRLLVLNKENGSLEDRKYSDIIDYLNKDDILVLNDTKVIKARLTARKSTGGNIEFIVLEKHGTDKDLAAQKIMYRGKIKNGDKLSIKDYKLGVINILRNGIAEVSCDIDLYKLAKDFGEVPIPPYLHRESERSDEERYQTVFARDMGSVAAPTASLNFTDELKEKLIEKGVKIVYITLHVGLGTFLPVREDDVEKHDMHSEYFIIPRETIETIRNAKKSGNKITALGTTVARTLEFAADNLVLSVSSVRVQDFEPLQSMENERIEGEANIFIYPGFKFKIVDRLITNFHAPRSTVLLLASAFAGTENLRKSYAHAIEKDYKFLSFGDTMMIF